MKDIFQKVINVAHEINESKETFRENNMTAIVALADDEKIYVLSGAGTSLPMIHIMSCIAEIVNDQMDTDDDIEAVMS